METAARAVLSTVLLLHLACDRTQPPNVLIVTVDTLRADYLGAFGDLEANTPNIDELARTATVFERAAAPMPLTRPSHFSLLTARYPREHGVLNNAIALPDEATTVTEILREHGYETAAFLSVRLLNEKSGAAQGFSIYDAPVAESQRAAKDTIGLALDWLDAKAGRDPFFLWVHLFDPHIPYAPPEEFRPPAVAKTTPIDWPLLNSIAAENDDNIPAQVLEDAKQLYRGEITYTDHWFGKLLTGVDAHSKPDNTIVVFAADHGECFENGSYFEHSDCLFEPAIRIPLIVRFPPKFPPGKRVEAQTSIIDIAPTVLRAAGIEIPSKFSGRALQDSATFEDRHVLIQHPFYQERVVRARPRKRRNVRTVGGKPRYEILINEERVGVVGGNWKYLRGGQDEQLYRISPETDERANRTDLEPETRAEMLDWLQRKLAKHPLELIAPSEINDELRETLRALGYLDN